MRPRTGLLPVIIILIAVLVGGLFYSRHFRRKREVALKLDLQTMRQAIDNYTLDKQDAPHSLEDLVRAHYIREIPIDPVCGRRDWNPHFGDTVISPDQARTGIDDVHSTCERVGNNGKPYNTW
jgi:general secretion pathway protein G